MKKTVVSDDCYLLIGTINLDYRSLAHHFEDAVWIYASPTVKSVKEEFLKTASLSDERDEKEARLTPIEWTVRNLVRIFAPLL
jgi:cardiolipin synthase